MLELFIRWFVIGAVVLGIIFWRLAKKDSAENAQLEASAIENIDEICDEFFDGSKTKIWAALEMRIPSEFAIAEAAERGYSVASKEGAGLQTKIVFVKA